MPPAPPAPRFTEFFTRDCDFASRRVGELFSRTARVAGTTASNRFFLKLQAATLGAVTLTCIDVGNFEVRREAPGAVVLALPQSGLMSMGIGANRRDHAPGGTIGIGMPGETIRIAADSGVVLSITAPVADLAARVERMTGSRRAAGPMAKRIDAGAPLAQALARAIRTALAEMAALQRHGLIAIAAAGHQELLLNLIAATLFPAVAGESPRPVDGGPVAVRRAREYIRAHAAGPIDISRLAADLGVSIRALQQNFQRSYGVSPRDYVLECRLERARLALLTPGPETSVTDIALASGFSDLSHFSVRYRDRYGELPSQTRGAAAG